MAALVVALPFAAGSGPADASELVSPQGPVILRVTGAVSATNTDGAAEFDLEMLRRLGVSTVRTSTPWTSGVITFEGVDAAALLEAVGGRGVEVVASALDDYEAVIPMSDIREKGPIIAFAADGQVLTVRDKGPLWIIFPFDTLRTVDDDALFTRAVWQLKALHVR